jgi:hypothetical protein
MIYLLTAIGLPPGDSSAVHIYIQIIHRTTQNKQYIEQHKILEEWGPCPVFTGYTLAFALQLRKKQGKTSVRAAEECQPLILIFHLILVFSLPTYLQLP